jgi:Asp-tRNA(Asn)/Glu-tRNA(Gln) amidotransferase A subunit family amidase
MVPAALGSQTAGSVIRPASFCGVVGFKPTYGVLDLAGVHPLAPSLDTLGFFVEKLEDAPIVFAALRGEVRPSALVPRKPRVGFCRSEQWGIAEPATQAAVEAAAAKLDARDVDLEPGLAEAQDIIMAVEAARALATERAAGEERLSRKLRDLLERGDRCPRERYDEAVGRMRRGRATAADAFRDADVLLTPSAPGEAPAGLGSTGDPAFNRIWTLLGVPCLSLPLLRGPAGLPLGLQLIGAPGKDAELLAAAAWIEGHLG